MSPTSYQTALPRNMYLPHGSASSIVMPLYQNKTATRACNVWLHQRHHALMKSMSTHRSLISRRPAVPQSMLVSTQPPQMCATSVLKSPPFSLWTAKLLLLNPQNIPFRSRQNHKILYTDFRYTVRVNEELMPHERTTSRCIWW